MVETTETQEQTETTESPETSETSNPRSENIESRFEEPDFSKLVGSTEDKIDSAEEVEEIEESTSAKAKGEDETESEETPAQEASAAEDEDAEEPEKEESKAEEKEEKKVDAEQEETPAEVHIPTKEELEGMYKEHREATLPTLEKLYGLTDEQAEAFSDNPKEALPKLAAQLHYDSMMSSYNAVMAALPAVVHRIMDSVGQANQAESTFFGEWPELNKPELAPVVQSAVRAYRASNPKAKLEEVIKKAGMLAMINAGIERKPKASTQTPPAKPKPRPARPVAPGGAPVDPPVSKPKEKNMFEELGEAWAEEFS